VAALLVVPACITARKTWISRMSIYKSRLSTEYFQLLRQWGERQTLALFPITF
jgi:hypothetical protein